MKREKFKQLQKVKEIYSRGENVIEYLKSLGDNEANSIEDILISYDFQSGSYVKAFGDRLEQKEQYTKAIANVIDELGYFNSILEIGVGEATTLGPLVKMLKSKPSTIMGLDISWSRLKFAMGFLQDIGVSDSQLFAANLFEIPLADNAIDVVYTSHSIEPNGGREKEALQELCRIANKYVVLLEPSYEFATDEGKARMERLGYVKHLHETAQELGYKVHTHRPFDLSINPLNPTGLLIIEKENQNKSGSAQLQCPITETKLVPHGDSFLYSEKGFLAYPVLDNIPCLLQDNAILATHLQTDYEQFKADNGVRLS